MKRLSSEALDRWTGNPCHARIQERRQIALGAARTRTLQRHAHAHAARCSATPGARHAARCSATPGARSPTEGPFAGPTAPHASSISHTISSCSATQPSAPVSPTRFVPTVRVLARSATGGGSAVPSSTCRDTGGCFRGPTPTGRRRDTSDRPLRLQRSEFRQRAHAERSNQPILSGKHRKQRPQCLSNCEGRARTP